MAKPLDFFVSPFNWVHIVVLLTAPLFIIAAYFCLRNAKTRIKDAFFWAIFGTIIVLFAVNFAQNLVLLEEWRETVLYKLPLHLCGLNAFLYPAFFALRNSRKRGLARTLMAFLFFVGSPAGLLGSVMPPPDCIGPLFTSNVFTYYFKHNMLFALPILMVALGYYRPAAKDMLGAAGILAGLAILMHGVNLAFSAWGGYLVNYFYTRSPEGNPVLGFFWNLVPVELVYSFLLGVILAPVFCAYYVPFALANLRQRKKCAQTQICKQEQKPL